MQHLKLLVLALLFPLFTYAQDDHIGDWKIDYTDENGMMQSTKLSIASNGTYTIDFGMNSNIEVKGNYEMADDKMTIWDTEGEYACIGEDKKGVYRVSVSSGSLTMTRISDGCPQRGSPEGIMTFQRIGS